MGEGAPQSLLTLCGSWGLSFLICDMGSMRSRRQSASTTELPHTPTQLRPCSQDLKGRGGAWGGLGP